MLIILSMMMIMLLLLAPMPMLSISLFKLTIRKLMMFILASLAITPLFLLFFPDRFHLLIRRNSNNFGPLN
jgi:hypothetical protein